MAQMKSGFRASAAIAWASIREVCQGIERQTSFSGGAISRKRCGKESGESDTAAIAKTKNDTFIPAIYVPEGKAASTRRNSL